MLTRLSFSEGLNEQKHGAGREGRSGEALGLLRLTFGLLKSGYPNYPGHPEKPVITTLALDLSFSRSTFFLVANALIVLCLRIVLLKPCFISRPNSSKTCFRILIPFV